MKHKINTLLKLKCNNNIATKDKSLVLFHSFIHIFIIHLLLPGLITHCWEKNYVVPAGRELMIWKNLIQRAEYCKWDLGYEGLWWCVNIKEITEYLGGHVRSAWWAVIWKTSVPFLSAVFTCIPRRGNRVWKYIMAEREPRWGAVVAWQLRVRRIWNKSMGRLTEPCRAWEALKSSFLIYLKSMRRSQSILRACVCVCVCVCVWFVIVGDRALWEEDFNFRKILLTCCGENGPEGQQEYGDEGGSYCSWRGERDWELASLELCQ